ELVASARHCRNISRLTGGVSEGLTQRGHSLVDGVRRNYSLAPDAIEKLGDPYDRAGPLCQKNEKPHSTWIEHLRLARAQDLAGVRPNPPISNLPVPVRMVAHQVLFPPESRLRSCFFFGLGRFRSF